MAIIFKRASGSTGTSHTIDIGTADNNRLVVAVLDHESTMGNVFNGLVTIDDKHFTQNIVADNPDGVGNHLELHTIDDTVLGSSNGSLSVSHSGDTSWAIHVLVFYGVNNNTIIDSGIEDAQIGYPVSVENITSNDNSLIIMAAGNGSSGTASTWTSPLIERTDGPNPNSAVLAIASGIETIGQTNKTYSVNIGSGTLRSTGIVAVFEEYQTQTQTQTHQMML